MSALFDHHVHSDRSDGTVSLADRAKSVALRPHGVSDHYPWRDKLPNEDAVKRYIDDASQLGLRVGLEYDLGVAPPLSADTRESLHYLIGAIHQLELDGERIPYDDAGAFVKGRIKSFKAAERFRDPELQRRILERTLEVVAEGINRERIDILGHPTFSALQALGDPERVYPEEWQERMIALCIAGHVAIEINESYGVPHREFLVRAARAGALFSVGTDTHFEIKPLDKTDAMISAAGISSSHFLSGSRFAREAGPAVRTRAVRYTRFNPATGLTTNDPATAFVTSNGSYVIRNDRTNTIVNISNRTDPFWREPWE